ncbi:MAG: hypothetical protein ABJ327_00315 [Litoreibacter sp.]
MAFVTAALFAALSYVAHFQLAPSVGGQIILDLRPFGYDSNAAQAFRDALNFESETLYLRTYLPIDFFFIAALTGLLFLLSKEAGSYVSRMCILMLAVGFMVSDIVENWVVHGLLTKPTLETDLVSMASMLTQGKFACLLSVLVVLVFAWMKSRPHEG